MEIRRDLPSGTPMRATGYVIPADRRRPLWWALGIAGAVLVVFAILFAAGRRGVASPGPVAAAHAAIGSRCAECHAVGRAVSDLRCERCHDPAASERLAQASHVGRGTGSTAAAHAGGAAPCASCHAEHRGNADLARAVDDRTCAGCHRVSSLTTHPEFAAVSAGRATGGGLTFTHDRHLAEVQRAGGQRCEACHQPTADLSAFEPIDFDRHCASCHTQDGRVTGETDPFDGRTLAPIAAAGQPLVTPGARTLVTVSRMTHRDDWVLDNLARLRRIVDPEGERAERLSLRTQIASLSAALRTQPLSAMTPADLARFRESLERDRASLAAGSATAAPDGKALAEMSAAIVRVADAVAAAATTAVTTATPPSTATPDPLMPPAAESVDEIRAHFEARRAELLAVLDAVSARGNPALTQRAAGLKARVAALTMPAAGVAAPGDAEALRARLRALDEIFHGLRGLPDQQAAADAAAIAALRDAAGQQIGGAVSIEQFEARRRELLRALEAIGRQGNAALAGRVAVLRQRVLMLQPGNATLEERRARVQRMLDRVSLELELAAGGETAAPSAVPPARDRRVVEPLLARLGGQLARLDRVPAAPSTVSAAAASAAIASLAGPCLKCHVLDGPRLASVAATSRVFRRAAFTHKPHVSQADCLSCHGGVTTSKLASDLVVPGIATCRTCHTPSQARNDCAACHTYHPDGAVELAARR